jgi:hypothetical protein
MTRFGAAINPEAVCCFGFPDWLAGQPPAAGRPGRGQYDVYHEQQRCLEARLFASDSYTVLAAARRWTPGGGNMTYGMQNMSSHVPGVLCCFWGLCDRSTAVKESVQEAGNMTQWYAFRALTSEVCLFRSSQDRSAAAWSAWSSGGGHDVRRRRALEPADVWRCVCRFSLEPHVRQPQGAAERPGRGHMISRMQSFEQRCPEVRLLLRLPRLPAVASR